MRINGRTLYKVAAAGCAALWGFIIYCNYKTVREEEEINIKRIEADNNTRKLEAVEKGEDPDDVIVMPIPTKMNMPEAMVEALKLTGSEVVRDIKEDPWGTVIKPGLIGAGIGLLYCVGYADGGVDYYAAGVDEGAKEGFSWGYANGVRHVAGWVENSLSDNDQLVDYVGHKMEVYKKNNPDKVDWINNVITYPEENAVWERADQLRRIL